MDHNNKIKRDVVEINWEQQKVLSHPLRARLVGYMYEQAMTPKQAADLVGKNPGTVYYHIQQLVKHEILEVERVDTDKGVVEKYYRAKGNTFKNPEKRLPAGTVDTKSTDIYMSKSLIKQLSEEIEDLFFKYGHLSHKEKDNEVQVPYSIEFHLKQSSEEEEENK